MKIKLKMAVLSIVVFLVLFGGMSVAFAMDVEAFKEEFYAPVQIREVVEPPKLAAGLTEEEMKSLLEVKQVLSDFMRSFRYRDRNPMEYLTKKRQGKYKDKFDLFRREFGAEVNLEFEVYEFMIKKASNRIKLRFFLTSSTEGIDTVMQREITFKKTSTEWKILYFENK